MSKPKKLYMKTPDARNPHGLTCESILRRLEADAMNGKNYRIMRWSDYAAAPIRNKVGSAHDEANNYREHARNTPVFYTDDGHILLGPYRYARTKPTDDGRLMFKGCTDLWASETPANSAMTLKLYSWAELVDDYNKNNQQLSVRFKTQAHNSKDPADYTDRLWDLNNLYVACYTGYSLDAGDDSGLFTGNAEKQLELCGYEWKA